MGDRLKDALHWALLFLLIALPSILFERAVSAILLWLVSCAYDVAPGVASALPMDLLLNFGRILAFYGMAGFSYCWFMDEDWRRSGLIAWAAFSAFEYIPLVLRVGPGPLLTTPWFYADVAAAGAAACLGAYLGEGFRTHPVCTEIRTRIRG